MSDRPRPQTTTSLVGTLHEIRWQEVCPWLILVKALRVSLMIRVLVLALLGVLLTQWGDVLIDRWCAVETAPQRSLTKPAPGDEFLQLYLVLDHSNTESLITPNTGPVLQAWQWVAKPFWLLADRQLSWQSSFALLVHGAWAIYVWAVFGGAIARIAAVYLARGQTLGPIVALRDAFTVWPGTVGSLSIALLAVVAMGLPLVLVGLLLKLDLLAVVAGLLWGVVLVWGFALAVIVVGVLIGWPLMWACQGVERSDAFDGVSRCYAYVYQRPLQLAFYVLVASLLAMLGEAVVTHFAAATLSLTETAVGWGAGAEHAATLLDSKMQNSATPLAIRGINTWRSGLGVFVASYPLACLWPMSVGIYLLLRRHVDATEMDEIKLDEVGSFSSDEPNTAKA